MAMRIAARYVSRRLSSSGKIFSEEEKAAENIYIKVGTTFCSHTLLLYNFSYISAWNMCSSFYQDDVVLGLACTDAIVYALLGFPFKFSLMGIIIGFALRVPYLFLS